MNWKLFSTISLWSLLIFIACRKDEISFDQPTQKLSISADTVVLDTVYNQMRSSTHLVKIFNNENKDIKIPKIYLGQGENSQYKINVDGKAGHYFTNIPLRSKDSLFVFIEIAPNIKSPEIVAEDHVYIESGIAQQKITLLSVIQDAEFFISPKDNPKIINNDTNWDKSKVKIILGELQLAEGKTLNIHPDTKVYFMQNSGLKINKNATLNISGDLGKEVILRGHRNEPRYDTIPKNWNGIVLEEGSKLNINYAKIFGGTTGLYLNQATAKVKNTILHTFQDYGIFAINTKIDAENLVINNTGISNIGIVKGGIYNILHSTLANFWSIFTYQKPTVISAQNEWITSNGKREYSDLTLNLKNSIAYTKYDDAIKLTPSLQSLFSYTFENSLIKHSANSSYAWENNSSIINSIKNLNPLFVNTFISKMNLSLKENSPAKEKGNPSTAQQVPFDIRKVNRTSTPNIGAYQ